MRIYLRDGGIGDVCALTGAVREYRRAYPLEPIHVNTGGRWMSLFERNPHAGAAAAGGRVVVLRLEEDAGLGNIVHSFCRQLGVECVNPLPEVFLSDAEKAAADPPLAGGRPILAVDPWARAECRRWRPERWVELVDRLRRVAFVVEVGASVRDYHEPRAVRRAIGAERRLVDRLTVRETAAILSRVDLFLGVDSGLSHLAAAVRTPSVVLFSRSRWFTRAYPGLTWPVFSTVVPCAGVCERECVGPVGRCLDRVSVDGVFDAVKAALGFFGRKDC